MEASDRLASWKEIATYLGVDVRTCQRWEKSLGLPVRRLDASAKSRVFASKVEIDTWMARVSSKPGAAESGVPVSGPSTELEDWIRRRKRLRNAIHLGLAAGALLVAAVLLTSFRGRDRVPADFHILGRDLIVTNATGHELWRKDTGLEDLRSEARYRRGFQQRRMIAGEPAVDMPQLMIRDLDGDGRVETLFAPVNEAGTLNGKLILYDDRGSERWSFDTGVDVVAGSRRYPPDFAVDGFQVEDLDGDGRAEILVVSHARIESPTRVLVLRLDKTILGEYWNFGQISDFLLRDTGRGGRPYILCAGQNNGYERPCLFLLDPRRLSGASPQDENSRFVGKAPGSELFYVLLPVSDLAKLKGPGDAASLIDPGPSGSFTTVTQFDFLKFDFDADIRLLAPVPSHTFQRGYAEALSNGAKLPPLDVRRVAAELAAGIRYYDGAAKGWVDHWARSNPR